MKLLKRYTKVTLGKSPLAEGRELKLIGKSELYQRLKSPLAEGRELKLCVKHSRPHSTMSPLAEGRELK